jgi:hypothetical protein
MEEAAFWAATPARLEAMSIQHAVFNEAVETEEQKIERELKAQAQFDAMLMGAGNFDVYK